jgi:hypothetical protein
MLRMRYAEHLSEDYADNIWRLFGSSVHGVIERIDSNESIKEERINVKYGNYTISGKADNYVEENGKRIIEDFKVTSAWSVVYNPEGKKEWHEQLNVYAWLWQKHGFEVDELRAITILRDHSSKEATRDNYPRCPVVTIKIPLWTLSEADRYVRERMMIHSQSEDLSDKNLPECTKEERWAKDDSFAVIEKGKKRATRVYPTMHEAIKLRAALEKDGKKVDIVERKGESVRCGRYCNVNGFCNQYRDM